MAMPAGNLWGCLAWLVSMSPSQGAEGSSGVFQEDLDELRGTIRKDAQKPDATPYPSETRQPKQADPTRAGMGNDASPHGADPSIHPSWEGRSGLASPSGTFRTVSGSGQGLEPGFRSTSGVRSVSDQQGLEAGLRSTSQQQGLEAGFRSPSQSLHRPVAIRLAPPDLMSQLAQQLPVPAAAEQAARSQQPEHKHPEQPPLQSEATLRAWGLHSPALDPQQGDESGRPSARHESDATGWCCSLSLKWDCHGSASVASFGGISGLGGS